MIQEVIEMSVNVSRTGLHKIATIFEEIGFAFREQPVEDYGIDAIIEERGTKYLTGKLIGVQIKCGTSYFKETSGNKIIYRGDNKHYDYWLNYSLPVIIVLYNPENDSCIYESITDDTIIKTSNGWKLEMDTCNRLEYAGNFLKRLGENQSEYQKRLATLAFSKGLMELADQKKLTIEVMEWINKSSGRGDFIIKALDDDGTERELYNKTILGFGPRAYDQVLPELFPWATLQVDDDYYRSHGNQKYIELKRQFNSNIYPYKNGAGEVDWYRFVPVINDVGKSFLTLDKFLNEGKMYHIKF
jgi:hypothetical protein